MSGPERDPADPDQLRQASRDTGAAAQLLHGGLQLSQSAASGFGAAPFAGGTATRFLAALGSIGAFLTSARDAHEQAADALRRVAGPIEDEQRARKRREERRQEHDDALDELAEAKSALAAARTELGAAQAAVVVQQARIALARAANTAREAIGQPSLPVDTSGLHEAERRVTKAEREVSRAERLVSRATDRVDEAKDRLDRARRRHEAAQRDRDTAVRALTMVLQLAGLPPLLPLAPGASSAPGGQPVSIGDLLNWSWSAGTNLTLLGLRRALHDDGLSRSELRAWAGARAGASGNASIGADGVEVRGSAGGFAGAEAGVSGSIGSERSVQAGGEAKVRAGIGLDPHAGVSATDGKLKIDLGLGGSLGIGGKVSGEVTVNPGGILEDVLNAPRNLEKVGRFFGL